jgi:hypothetical protein
LQLGSSGKEDEYPKVTVQSTFLLRYTGGVKVGRLLSYSGIMSSRTLLAISALRPNTMMGTGAIWNGEIENDRLRMRLRVKVVDLWIACAGNV